jgi:hypothetical protein
MRPSQNNTAGIREFTVPNEGRELRFKGEFLAFSSTEDRGGDRWIEFVLYRTATSGKYVLSRIGRSVRFHSSDCSTVVKNALKPVPLATLSDDTSPCPMCLPSGDGHLADNALIYPEQDRTWAGVYNSPHDLISGLSREDSRGSSSLTVPAKLLLERACERDNDLKKAYFVVEID